MYNSSAHIYIVRPDYLNSVNRVMYNFVVVFDVECATLQYILYGRAHSDFVQSRDDL